MYSSQWTKQPALLARFAPSPSAEKARALADSLMGWGHAAGFCGSVVGIVGGFGLVLGHAESRYLAAALFGGPLAGLAVSALLYAAAWYADKLADKREASTWAET